MFYRGQVKALRKYLKDSGVNNIALLTDEECENNPRKEGYRFFVEVDSNNDINSETLLLATPSCYLIELKR